MTALLLDPIYQQHDTGPGHPESIQRHVAVTKALVEAGHAESMLRIEPRTATRAELELCHTCRLFRNQSEGRSESEGVFRAVCLFIYSGARTAARLAGKRFWVKDQKQ